MIHRLLSFSALGDSNSRPITRSFVPVAAYTSLDQVSALCWNNYNIFFRSSSGKVTVIRNPNWIGECKRDDNGYGVPTTARARIIGDETERVCKSMNRTVANNLHGKRKPPPPPQLVLCCVNVHVPTPTY